MYKYLTYCTFLIQIEWEKVRWNSVNYEHFCYKLSGIDIATVPPNKDSPNSRSTRRGFKKSKSNLVAGLLLMTSACSSQFNGVPATSEVLASNKLSGKEFCRIIETGGMFGQPRGKGEHCVKFLDASKVIDNANTFFGNPPETGTYSVAGKTITLSFENKKIYVLSRDGESISDLEGKQVLTLKSAKKSLAKKEFCRIVETGGILGRPRGKGEHCVKFLDAREVIDNANTFFGNPPQRGTYSLDGKSITLNFEDKKIYVLSSDGLSISDLEGQQVLTLK